MCKETLRSEILFLVFVSDGLNVFSGVSWMLEVLHGVGHEKENIVGI